MAEWIENGGAVVSLLDRIGGWALALAIIGALSRAVYILYRDARVREQEQTEALHALSGSLRELTAWLRERLR